MSDAYVQYGSGTAAPPGWRHFDASPTLRFERLPLIGRWYTKNANRFHTNVEYGDIVKGLPVPPASCTGVYCSHVLEHLALEDLRRALLNTHRILAEGGIFRLVVPDLEHLSSTYIDDPSPDAAIRFMQGTGLGRELRQRKLLDFVIEWLGNSQHLWLWDYKGLEQELTSAGFRNVRRAWLGDSDDPMFNSLERSDRWRNCLGMECRK